MGWEFEKVRHLINARLAEASSNSFYGTVETVDEHNLTCEVRIGEIVYEGVLLYAIVNEKSRGLIVVPKPGSTVLVSRIAASSRYYVEMFSDVEKLLLSIGERESDSEEDGEAGAESDTPDDGDPGAEDKSTGLLMSIDENFNLSINDNVKLSLTEDTVDISVEDNVQLSITGESVRVALGEKVKMSLTGEDIEASVGENVNIRLNESDGISASADSSSLVLDSKGFDLKAGTFILSADSGGMVIGPGNALMKTLDKLCEALTMLTVTTPMGPSGPPINLASFTAIQGELITYFKK